MGTFSASLRAVGDTSALPATVRLEDGQLSIAAGSHQIGSWALSDIQLEPLPNGYRMAAEGDQIIIELKELDAFREALDNGRFKRRPKLRGREKRTARTETADVAQTSRPAARSTEQVTKEPKPEKKTPTTSGEGLTNRGLTTLDRWLNKSQKRLGPYLPDWMFSRAMVFILLTVLAVMVIFPALLLIAGGLIIALGAVAYSDPMIASRWLPGRTQPPQVLIVGVCVLLFGVLVGMIRG